MIHIFKIRTREACEYSKVKCVTRSALVIRNIVKGGSRRVE